MNCCGLLTAQKEPVPLKSIEVELEVRDHVATVVSTLTYENKEDKPVEAVFVFPLPGDAAVCHFSAKIGQTQIVAEVKEKQQCLYMCDCLGAYVQIFCDGSKSVEYSQSSMEEALKKVELMEANLGGTEILKPLKHIYSQPCIPSQPRQLFVFTDGEVFNTKEVINLVKTNSGSHRCFSFGIGEGASSALINGLAKEGGGHAQFITETDRMQPKVMQSLRFALQPAVVDITVTWDLPKGVSVTALSPPITAVFQGQRSLVYAQLTGKSSEAAQGCVTVKYSLAGHPSENQLPFNLKPAEDTGLTVHRLGARTLIRSLEMEEREHSGQQDGGVKKKVVELSVQSGVSSPFTAFIAVNKSNGKPIQGPVVRRDIPLSGMMMGAPLVCNSVGRMNFCVGAMVQPMSFCRSKRSVAPDTVSFQACSMTHRGRMLILGGRPLSAPLVCDSLPSIKTLDDEDIERPIPKQPCRDPLLQVVSLQNASGSWLLNPALADVLGKTSEEVDKSKPALVNQEVWATILALIWLHAFKMDAKEEWELLAMKAVSWLRAQNAPSVAECVKAGNALLGCKVQEDVLGL
ncbi:von Willebrand factor A domain-containing protein 5A-like [Seriola lalandi dorsalis]|uniref:von Willebrand factor A domain-containing protein 5A-like n=1 Tax=Seriola lalandi dorsalis TaxID=1841481 RepID=UPI000C6FA336|nr:von Willebrand factor A domain-containing protein 5A-like [Seriola lalandi dorsalis]